MKESKKISFSNATITKENDKYIIIETTKDEDKTYDLTNRLEEFVGVEGISLQISKTEDIESEE